MPLSLTGHSHIMKTPVLPGRGETLETPWAPCFPPTRAPQMLPAGCPTLGTPPRDTTELAPSPTLLPVPGTGRGSALQGCKWGQHVHPRTPPKLPEPSPPDKKIRNMQPQASYAGASVHRCAKADLEPLKSYRIRLKRAME